jgi:hypothetical protein
VVTLDIDIKHVSFNEYYYSLLHVITHELVWSQVIMARSHHVQQTAQERKITPVVGYEDMVGHA